MKNLNLFLFEKVCLSFLIIVVLFISVDTAIAQEQEANINTEKSPKFESQLEELITTVYCYCGCTRETIKACICATAQNVETDFRGRLLAGDTVDVIRTEYLDKWGPQFYAVMPAKGINLIAYLMPVVILIAIGGVIFTVLIVQHESRGSKIASAQPDKQIPDELQQYVESELEKYKEQN